MGAYNKCIAISGIYGMLVSVLFIWSWSFINLGLEVCMAGLIFSSCATFIGFTGIKNDKTANEEPMQYKIVEAEMGGDNSNERI